MPMLSLILTVIYRQAAASNDAPGNIDIPREDLQPINFRRALEEAVEKARVDQEILSSGVETLFKQMRKMSLLRAIKLRLRDDIDFYPELKKIDEYVAACASSKRSTYSQLNRMAGSHCVSIQSQCKKDLLAVLSKSNNKIIRQGEIIKKKCYGSEKEIQILKSIYESLKKEYKAARGYYEVQKQNRFLDRQSLIEHYFENNFDMNEERMLEQHFITDCVMQFSEA